LYCNQPQIVIGLGIAGLQNYGLPIQCLGFLQLACHMGSHGSTDYVF
jgi:hypothetical protein